MYKVCRINLVLLSFALLTACGIGDGIIGTGADDKVTISGAAQKGPFVLGSSVTVNRLTVSGDATENTLTTQTSDDLGNFSFSLGSTSPIQISVEGYHFNEIVGKPSDSTLTLRAIYQPSSEEQQTAHVNISTHLIHNRVLTLMGEGEDAISAIHTAQTEWIATFQKVLIIDDLSDFTNLNLFDIDDTFSDGNAYLLALSAIIYQLADSNASIKENSVDAELTSLLNYLANDFANDGEISDEVILGDLATASRLVRPNNIEENLANRSYQVTNQRLQVAQMNRFIDSDGDGIVNIDDDDDDNDGYLDIDDITPYGTRPERINGNYKPLAASSKMSTNEDTELSLEFLVHDLDNDDLSLFVVTSPRLGQLSGEYPEITYTPYPDVYGTDKITFKVSDSVSDSPEATLEIIVEPRNDPPTISGNPKTVILANQLYTFTPFANDVDRNKLTFMFRDLPAWLSPDKSTGRLTGTPRNENAGTHVINISVTDGNDVAFLKPFNLIVEKNPWRNIAVFPQEYNDPTIVEYNGELYLFGRKYSNGIVYSYDPISNSWLQKSSIPDIRESFNAHTVGDKIYLFVTRGDYDHFQFFEYSPDNENWEKKGTLPTPRRGFTSSTVNNKIYIIGGIDVATFSNQRIIEIYDPITKSWSKANDAPFDLGSLSRSCVLGDNIYVIGNTRSTKINIYDTIRDVWLNPIDLPSPRSGHSCAGINEEIVVFGGQTQTLSLSKVESYSPLTGDWNNLPSMFSTRSIFQLAVIGDKIYILGGRKSDDNYHGIEFDPSIID